MPAWIVRPLAWLSAAAVVGLTLAPPRYRIVTGAPRDLEHIAAFALVGLMLALAYRKDRPKIAALSVVAIAAIELMQLVVPGRHAYLSDFLLNVLGFCMGWTSALILGRTSQLDRPAGRQSCAGKKGLPPRPRHLPWAPAWVARLRHIQFCISESLAT